MTKIQLGCGSNRLEGFKNYDSELDITKLPLPFQDNSVDFLFAEHLYEHVTPIQGLHLLDDIRRCLKPNGIIRLCIPVLERLSPEKGRDIIVNHGHKAAYSTQTIKDILRIAGFRDIKETPRSAIDSHWKVIGREKDDRQTARIEAVK